MGHFLLLPALRDRQVLLSVFYKDGRKEGETQLLVQGHMSDMLGFAHRVSHPKAHALLEAPCHRILETKNNEHFQHCTDIYLAFFILFRAEDFCFL